MLLICMMAKSFLVSGKKVIKGIVLFVFEIILVFLREGYMEVN